jgi:hypothetical protein
MAGCTASALASLTGHTEGEATTGVARLLGSETTLAVAQNTTSTNFTSHATGHLILILRIKKKNERTLCIFHLFVHFQVSHMSSFLPLSCKNALRGPYWIGTTRYDTPLPAGWLPGDSVHLETREIQRGKHPPLIGIVDLTNRTRFGFSSRGVPQYLFFPLNAGYPPMIVGSKAPTTTNQFGIVRFEHWNTTKSKWPHGALQELVGPVGDSATELRALRLQVCPPHRQTTHGYDFSPSETLCGLEETWDACFNIDPPGCKDVDDVLSWRRTVTGHEFGIHIANVATWISVKSDLDKEAKQRGTTVYEEGVVLRPMLPPELSEKKASLLSDGKSRPVLSAIWHISDSGDVSGPVWRPTQILIQESFTYDSILTDSAKSQRIPTYLQAICGDSGGQDPHRWIELAMIAYNRATAKKLKEKGAGLLRRHKGALPSSEILRSLADQTGCADIAWLGQTAGEYCSAVEEDCKHAGLGEALYCHATSPLRRYADLVNQRILLGICCENMRYDELSHHLNLTSKAIRAWERDVWCLRNLKPSEISEAPGWILGWKQWGFDLRLLVYVPFWKRTVRIGFFSEEREQTSEVYLKPRDFGKFWIGKRGDQVQVRAFCNLQKAQWSERFVFTCHPA